MTITLRPPIPPGTTTWRSDGFRPDTEESTKCDSDNRTFMRNTIDRHYLVAVTLCYALEIDCMISFKLKTNTNWRSNNA